MVVFKRKSFIVHPHLVYGCNAADGEGAIHRQNYGHITLA